MKKIKVLSYEFDPKAVKWVHRHSYLHVVYMAYAHIQLENGAKITYHEEVSHGAAGEMYTPNRNDYRIPDNRKSISLEYKGKFFDNPEMLLPLHTAVTKYIQRRVQAEKAAKLKKKQEEAAKRGKTVVKKRRRKKPNLTKELLDLIA